MYPVMKFELPDVETAKKHAGNHLTMNIGKAVLTAHPIVVQVLDSRGFTKVEPSKYDLSWFKENFNYG